MREKVFLLQRVKRCDRSRPVTATLSPCRPDPKYRQTDAMAGGGGMCGLKSIRTRTVPTTTALDQSNFTSLRELKRTKLIAGAVLAASLAVLVVAKLLERYIPGLGF